MQQIQNKIYDLLEEANQKLPPEDALYYSGNFVTGCIFEPSVLFLGINPGFESKAWSDRDTKKSLIRTEFKQTPCKYIEEYEDGFPLAKAVVNIICSGNASALASCTETSIKSFFATPNEKILNQSLAQLSPLWHQKHNQLIKNSIQAVKPKHIVCIGLNSFNKYLSYYDENSYDTPTFKSELSSTGKTEPVYYKHTKLNGVDVHGLLHLSGARLSAKMLESIKPIFKNIFLSNDNESLFSCLEKVKEDFYIREKVVIELIAKRVSKNDAEYQIALNIGLETLRAMMQKYPITDKLGWSIQQTFKRELINVFGEC